MSIDPNQRMLTCLYRKLGEEQYLKALRQLAETIDFSASGFVPFIPSPFRINDNAVVKKLARLFSF